MKIIDRIKENTDLIRGVIYARYSSNNQRTESIDAQVRAALDFAAKNEIIIVDQYIDIAKSGTNMYRPGFQAMITAAEKKTFDIVLVHKFDRFARNRQDSFTCRQKLLKNNVQLVSVTEYFDEGPESIILESVLEGISEYYSVNLAREVRKGLLENALQGKHTGGKPPLGYDVDPGSKQLIINEREAQIVRMIFNMYCQGYSYQEMARILNTQSMKTKRGQDFRYNSFYNILINEKYTGTYFYNKTKSKDDNGKRNSHAYKHFGEIVRIDGAVPVIIKNDIFSLAQQMISCHKNHGNGQRKENYLLSGLVICGCCGGKYTGSRRFSGRNKSLQVVYQCSVRKHEKICTNKEVGKDRLEAAVLSKLSDYLFNDSNYKLVQNDYLAHMEKWTESQNTLILAIKKKIIGLENEVQALMRFATRTFSTTTYDTLANKLDVLLHEKEICANDLNEAVQAKSILLNGNDDPERAYEYTKSMFANSQFADVKRIIGLFVQRIVLSDESLCIHFNDIV